MPCHDKVFTKRQATIAEYDKRNTSVEYYLSKIYARKKSFALKAMALHLIVAKDVGNNQMIIFLKMSGKDG